MRALLPTVALLAFATGGCLFKTIVVADGATPADSGVDVTVVSETGVTDANDVVDARDVPTPPVDCGCSPPVNDERAGAIQILGEPVVPDGGVVDASRDATASDAGVVSDVVDAVDVPVGADAGTMPTAWGAIRIAGASTVHATHSVDAPCDSTRGGADVWYRIDLTRREVVYADTFGASWRTLLLFTDASGTPLARGTTTNVTCDANGACVQDTGSQVVAVLDAGTYYLVLSGVGTDSGTLELHVKHAATGAGSVAVLPSGATAVTGSAASGTDPLGLCPALATGTADAYWWVTCPSDAGGQLTASVCPTSFSAVNLIYVDADLGPLCTNATMCSFNSGGTLGNLVAPHEGLHALYVIERNTTGNGSYSLMVTRP